MFECWEYSQGVFLKLGQQGIGKIFLELLSGVNFATRVKGNYLGDGRIF
jgi:hypothetical protein